MSQTVVLALDSSDLSARALPFARGIAQVWRGRIVVVHAVVHPDRRRPGPDPVERQLADLVSALRKEGIETDAVVRDAPPARAIADVARAQHADLIIMASHQRHGLDRWLHGSVTEQVLVNTATPLLVVPAQALASSSQRSVRVLVPLDGSPAGEAALDMLTGWALRRPIELLLLRIVTAGPMVVGWAPAYVVAPVGANYFEAEVREAQSYLAERARYLSGMGLPVRRQVIETAEPVAKVILDVAQREQVDSIAIGTHGKGGVARLVLGSASEDVLEQSRVPVLLARPRAAVSSRSPDGATDSSLGAEAQARTMVA